jgi:hypothetical protein
MAPPAPAQHPQLAAAPPSGPRSTAAPKYLPPAERAAAEAAAAAAAAQAQAAAGWSVRPSPGTPQAQPAPYPPQPAPYGGAPYNPYAPGAPRVAPPARGRSGMLIAALAAVVLLGGGTFAGVVLHTRNTGSSTGASASADSSAGTTSETPVPTQQADMTKVRQAYLASMAPLPAAWTDLDNAIKSAESKPCGGCPPGTFDLRPVIPKIYEVVQAYENSIDGLSIIESQLEGQPSSDVGALVNGERRALVAFENELTEGANPVMGSGLAGTLVQANKDVQDLDNTVRKDIGLTPAPPVT